MRTTATARGGPHEPAYALNPDYALNRDYALNPDFLMAPLG